MNIRKFLKKLAQVADFQQVNAPAETGEVQGFPAEGEQGVIEPAQQTAVEPAVNDMETGQFIIETALAPWTPFRGPNKGKTSYYLQLLNIPQQIQPEQSELLTTLGYKFSKAINPSAKMPKGRAASWSKLVNESNALTIDGELDNISQAFGVAVSKNVIDEIRQVLNIDQDFTTEMTGDISEDVKKIKYTNVTQQQAVAEEMLKSKLTEMAENLNSEETKAFIDQYLAVKKATSQKVHPYSFMNSMLISWQNFDMNEDGKRVNRSGFIAPASLWKKEFGREISPESQGMEIFVPTGGKKTFKGGGQSALLTALGQFSAMNGGRVDLTNDDNIRKMFGFFKGLVAKKQMYQSNVSFLSNKFNKNREQFKTVKDIQDYLGGMLQRKEEENYYASQNFLVKPVIFDIDQTTVIPGQEHKDPKPKMDAIRGMWLGMRNEPDKLTDTLYEALADGARNGLLTEGKPINIETKDTGRAGGWSSGGDIAIGKDSQGERRFRTLVHEAAHEILHWGQDRGGLSHKQKEIDADATAYVVLNHYGVGTGAESLNYISLLTKNKNDVMDRLQPVLKASNAIIAAIEKQKGIEYDDANPKQAKTNWYGRFKLAHYSEPEGKGEGYGGTGQFGERRIEEWSDEHREEIKIMAGIIKRQDWAEFERYKQKLMESYQAPKNKTIVDSIVASAMNGQRF